MPYGLQDIILVSLTLGPRAYPSCLKGQSLLTLGSHGPLNTRICALLTMQVSDQSRTKVVLNYNVPLRNFEAARENIRQSLVRLSAISIERRVTEYSWAQRWAHDISDRRLSTNGA